jgi:hypothetical protein
MRPITILFIAIACLFSFTPNADANQSYAKAHKVGKAHAPSCGKGFIDIKGHCWECPSGYHHNPLLPASHKHACKKSGHTVHHKGKHHGSSIAGICKKGVVSLHDGECYTCPKGYHHNPSKAGHSKKFCFKRTHDKFAHAKKQGGSILCEKGFFDVTDGGSCWTCPKDYPHRTLIHGVKSTKACRSDVCGGENQAPCSILKGPQVCDKGLIPNYIIGECVNVNVKETVCRETVKAIHEGKKLAAGIAHIAKKALHDTKKKNDSVNKKAVIKQVGDFIDKHTDKIDEIKRIYVAMDSNRKKVEALFADKNFCSGSAEDHQKRLAALDLKPLFGKKKAGLFDGLLVKSANASASEHFYMAYTATVNADLVSGVQGGLAIVTDYRGNGGGYVFVGPEIVTNDDIGFSLGVEFYPHTSEGDFEGWGWGVGISGGPPSKAVGAGVSGAFSEKFFPQGFGIDGSIGLGLIPADVGLSGTYTWKIWDW